MSTFDTQLRAPAAVRAASLLWFTALAAGVVETYLAVGTEPLPLALRAVVTAVLAWIVVRMRAGARWARLTLAVLLGGIGTLSLVYDPRERLLRGRAG